ncbi:MAG TPA: hypothetical protein VHE80_05285 [Acidimicrobiales bacterium]|nr:hypothetical protein [Acidimicrobiales bacterium]
MVAYLEAVHQRAARRAGQVVETALDTSALDPEAFLTRVLDNEKLLLLLAMAVDAARHSQVEAKVQAPGRALASGALAADDAEIDEAQLVASTLADLEAPH